MDYFLGEVRLFPFAWAPKGWLPCDGSLLQIAQNTALFSLLGITYGGDGKTTFGLPDLRGRVAACQGDPQVEAFPFKPGTKTGTETAAIPASILPQHDHKVFVSTASTGNIGAQGGVPAIARRATYVAAKSNTAVVINSASVSPTPGAPVANMQPSLVLNYCICTSGIYPPHQ